MINIEHNKFTFDCATLDIQESQLQSLINLSLINNEVPYERSICVTTNCATNLDGTRKQTILTRFYGTVKVTL